MIKVFSMLMNGERPLLRIDTSLNPECGKLVSFNLDNLDRGDNTDTIAWGIFSNKGEISFVLPNEHKDLFKDDADFTDYQFLFYTYNDEEVSTSITLISAFYVKDFKYDSHTKIVEVELTDRLEDWQNIEVNINIPQIKYELSANLRSVYDTVYAQNPTLPQIDTSNVDELLGRITVYYSYRITTMSFWDFVNEICYLTATRVTVNEMGSPEFFIGDGSNAIKVNSKDILSIEVGCAKRHNSISSVSINIPREKDLKAVTNTIEPEKLTFEKHEGTYVGTGGIEYSKFDFSYLFQNTSEGRASKIKVNESTKDANVTNRDSFNTLPRNLLWKYGKPGDIKNVDLTFHDNDLGEIKTFKIAGLNTDEPYVESLTGTINSYEYMLIASESVSWGVTFDPAQISSLEVYGEVFVDGGNDKKTKSLLDNGANSIELNSSPWIYIAKKSGEDLHTWLFNKVSKLANGRNCIEIDCVLDNYYDNNGILVKTKGTPFGKYDVIIPYVYKKDVNKKSELKPYLGTDENPMKFIVTGVNYSYAGHFVQKLHLQEYVED